MTAKSWAMRKRDLPGYPWSPFDYDVEIWRGEHPSPAFKGCLVWWHQKIDLTAFNNMLKQVYSDESITSLVPKY